MGSKRALDRFLGSISHLIRWSNLSLFGSSSIAKITILFPFVGYAILFNQFATDFFSTYFPHDNPRSTRASLVNTININRIYFIYFGLLFIGIGSAIFSLFAPDNLKRGADRTLNILYLSNMNSTLQVFESFRSALNLYKRGTQYNATLRKYAPNLKLVPSALNESFTETIERIVKKAALGRNLTEWHTFNGHRLMKGESISTQTTIRVLSDRPNGDEDLIHELLNGSEGHESDIYLLEYDLLDFSMFYRRLITAIFFIFGLSLLFVPTITTIIDVLSLVFIQ